MTDTVNQNIREILDAQTEAEREKRAKIIAAGHLADRDGHRFGVGPMPVSGKPVPGKPVSGKPVSGKPVPGKPVSGKRYLDWSLTDRKRTPAPEVRAHTRLTSPAAFPSTICRHAEASLAS